MPDLIKFKWARSKGGYALWAYTPTPSERRKFQKYYDEREIREEYMDGEHWDKESFNEREHMLRYCRMVPLSKEIEEYEPLKDCSGLYKEFISLKDTPAEYVRFANDYGLLEDVHGLQGYEVMSSWFNLRNTMGHMIKKWENCSDNESVDHFIENYSGYLGACSLTLGKSFDGNRLSLHLTPDNLVNAMDLQFFQVISSNLRVQRCAVCPKWFTFGAGTGRRKSAHYCSDRCRKTAWLASQKKSKK